MSKNTKQDTPSKPTPKRVDKQPARKDESTQPRQPQPQKPVKPFPK